MFFCGEIDCIFGLIFFLSGIVQADHAYARAAPPAPSYTISVKASSHFIQQGIPDFKAFYIIVQVLKEERNKDIDWFYGLVIDWTKVEQNLIVIDLHVRAFPRCHLLELRKLRIILFSILVTLS